MKQEALAAAQEAARQKEEAEKAKAEAVAQQQALAAETVQARAAAAQSENLRQQAESEKQDLRERLLQQLNSILATRDSARGLVANMSDVLFRSGSFELLPEPASGWRKYPASSSRIPACTSPLKDTPTASAATNITRASRSCAQKRFATTSCSREFPRSRLKRMASARPIPSLPTTRPKAASKTAA